MNSLFNFFRDGGPFMYTILAVSVIAMVTILERGYVILFRYNLNGGAFMAQIQKLIMANNIDRAIKLCNAEANAVLTRVFKAGLTRANRRTEDVRDAVEEAKLEVVPMVQRRTAYLGMWARVAALLGLLGTIHGIVQALDAVGAASPETRQALLAKGVAVAMYATGYGLVVAISIMICASIIESRSKKLIDEIEQYSVKLINLLAARTRGVLKDEPAPG